MKIFIDSADVKQIRKFRELRMIQGATTNPGIFGTDGISQNPLDLLRKLVEVLDGDYLFVQVVATNPQTQVEEAKFLSDQGPNIVIKVIMDEIALTSIPQMISAGLQVCATAVNSIGRAILAAECGAHYMIPYYGFLEDTMEQSTHLVSDVAQIYEAQGYGTKMHIYCKRVADIAVAAKAGCWGVLLSPEDLPRFFHHAQTEIAVRAHATAWKQRYGTTNWLNFRTGVK